MKKLVFLLSFLIVFININTKGQTVCTPTQSIEAPYFNVWSNTFGPFDLDGDYAVIFTKDDGNTNCLLVMHYNGSEWEYMAKLHNSYNYSISSVAIDGDVIVAGNDDNNMAFVYVRTAEEWTDTTETAILTGSNVTSHNYFGYAVDIQNDVIIVGAPYATGNGTGAVYVYEKPANGWQNMTETAILYTTETGLGLHLGKNVLIENNTIFAASYSYYTDAEGAVYIFEKNSTHWTDLTPVAKLYYIPAEYMSTDFGYTMAYYDNNLFVGNPDASDPDQGLYSYGEVNIYKKPSSGWQTTNVPDGKLTLETLPNGAYLSTSGIVITGDYAYIGASNSRKKIFVFHKNGTDWGYLHETDSIEINDQTLINFISDGNRMMILSKNEEEYRKYVRFSEKNGDTFQDPNGLPLYAQPSFKYNDNEFGISIDIDGDYAVIGAPNSGINGDEDFIGKRIGRAYVYHYQNNQWTKIADLSPSVNIPCDFGYNVAIDDSVIIVTTGNDINDTFPIFVFTRPTGGWHDTTETAILVSSDNQLYPQYIEIKGDLIAAGYHDKIYLFKKPDIGWHNMAETSKLENSDNDLIRSLSIFGDTIMAVTDYKSYFFVHPYSNKSYTETFSIDIPYSSKKQSNENLIYCPSNSNQDFVVWKNGTDWHNYTIDTIQKYGSYRRAIISGTNIFRMSENYDTITELIKENGIWKDKRYFIYPENNFEPSFDYDNKNLISKLDGQRKVVCFNIYQIGIQPVSIMNQCTNQPAIFEIDAGEAQSFQWQISTDGGNNFTYLYDNAYYHGTWTDSLTIFPTVDMDSNLYRCIVTFPDNSFLYSDTVMLAFETLPPEFNVNNIMLYLNENGTANLTADDVIFNASDECGIADTVFSQQIFDCNDVGINTIYATLTDNSGNSQTLEFLVQVLDTIIPNLVLKDTTLALDENGQRTINPDDIIAYIEDNCQMIDTILSEQNFYCNDLGMHTITVTVHDPANNSATASANVNIVDNSVSFIQCINDTTVVQNGNGSYTISGTDFDVDYFDNCGVDLVYNSINGENSLDGVILDTGSNVIIWYVTDINGNIDSCSFNINVLQQLDINKNENKTLIYPNPASDIINVKTYYTPYNITIINAQGQIVYNNIIKTNQRTIPIKEFKNGIYILKITNDTFSKSYRLIINN